MSVNDQLARITNSPPMVSSPSLCRFLRYIVEETLAGRAAGIKEQVLGLAVFDRGTDFNPRLDPIVRVQARNLRSRIAKYYEGPGQADPIRIELPKGTYIPVFQQVGPPAETRPEGSAQVTPGPAANSAKVPFSAAATASVMPAPPPRSPVMSNRQMPPRFVWAAMILVVILAGITVLWISRTHAAPRTGVGGPLPYRQSACPAAGGLRAGRLGCSPGCSLPLAARQDALQGLKPAILLG